MALYGHSPAAIVATLYPTHKWVPWKFAHSKRGAWNSVDHQRAFLEEIRKEMKLGSSLDSFYSFDKTLVSRFGGIIANTTTNEY